MTLSGALQIGNSALQAHQRAIEVAGNNLANVATRGYHRQSINLNPTRATEIQNGIFIGRGVHVSTITRHVDEALEARIRTNVADESYSLARRDILAQIEALQNEFTDADLSSHLNAFFNSFSELANNPQDNSLRTLALRQGSNLANFVRDLRIELTKIQLQVDGSIDSAAARANNLLTQIAEINGQIAKSGGNPALRDTRDALLTELSQFVDISIHEQPSGSVDVFVGSLPVILNNQSRGIEIRRLAIDDKTQVDLVLATDGSVLQPASGRLGALVEARKLDTDFAVEELDHYINTFIFEINKVHSQGQALVGFNSVTGTSRVREQAFALNEAASGLKFTPQHGSFQLHVTQASTGQRISTTINIDLDGIDPANDATLSSLMADLDAVNNVAASITLDGRLTIAADGSDLEISFSEDSSSVLAALGINTFFSGTNAEDIAVNPVVNQTPGMIAAALEHLPGDNRNTLALAQLRDRPLASLSGLTVVEAWSRHVAEFAMRIGQAEQQLEADTLVGDSLEAQQQSISGVNADEETINLLAFQRAYQGSARFLQVVDELLETLMALV